jgi:hypothetical protein
MSTIAFAQPRSISKIVDKSSISEDGENKIKKYAVIWAEQLQTTDAETLEQARSKLIDPFEPGVRMTPYARSLYGKYLNEGFTPLLSKENENEMAAVNALQVLSLLGTEQASDLLLKHADISTEDRSTLRLWASIGLGTSFLTGELPDNRVERYAQLLSNFTKKETEWFVLARQFDSLASLQSIPNQDRNQQNYLEVLSFQLQTTSLVNLLNSINASNEADLRAQALPFILPSLLLQLIEPSVDKQVKIETLEAIVPPLIAFVEYAATNQSDEEDTFLRGSYGGAAHSASLLISRGIGSSSDEKVINLWNSGNYPAILELVETWKASQ